MSDHITANSLVTLRYRLSCDGQTLVSTMDGHPSTFQLGTGELAPPLEACLIGMEAPKRASFDLPPTAFGAHNADLMRWVARSEFPAETKLVAGEVVTLAVAPGQQVSGLVRELNESAVRIDLNHPLAGRSVSFEVDVIGVI
jgi:FKBP-type peptidyl-prolyl cis-trans isomerase SlpA